MINYDNIKINITNATLTGREYEAIVKLTCTLGSVNDSRQDMMEPSLAGVLRSKIIEDIYPELKNIYTQELIESIDIEEIAKVVRYKIINAAVRGDI